MPQDSIGEDEVRVYAVCLMTCRVKDYRALLEFLNGRRDFCQILYARTGKIRPVVQWPSRPRRPGW